MDPFLGQLLLVGFNFAPVNWFMAGGQILPISQNTALFSLLGTYYGGNGTTNFALPNLQGRVPVGAGQAASGTSYFAGEDGGEETVTLTKDQLPSHSHTPMADITPANQPAAAGNAFAKPTSTVGNVYSQGTSNLIKMSPDALTPFQGGNGAHDNMMPYLAMNWIIAYNGIFPPRS